MTADKAVALKPIHDVLRPSGLLVWQSYASREATMGARIRRALAAVGYVEPNVPFLPDLPGQLAATGFDVLVQRSLHGIYRLDNRRMLQRARDLAANSGAVQAARYVELLEAEQELFATGTWTGVLLVALRRS